MGITDNLKQKDEASVTFSEQLIQLIGGHYPDLTPLRKSSINAYKVFLF